MGGMAQRGAAKRKGTQSDKNYFVDLPSTVDFIIEHQSTKVLHLQCLYYLAWYKWVWHSGCGTTYILLGVVAVARIVSKH